MNVAEAAPFVGMGLTFGLAGGLSPGPLTALVVSQTVRFGLREGCTVALAPIVTDGPLIAIAALAVGGLAAYTWAISAIAFVGAAFLLWLAFETFNAPPIDVDVNAAPQSLRKSVLTNLLNPHPYLFWLAVGGPVVVDAVEAGWLTLVLFLTTFFVAIVGSS